MSKPPTLLSLIVVLVVLTIFGVVGARYMLSSHSESTLTQLGTVWPDMSTMPEPERSFLVELALTCNVVARPAVRAEVIDCLRSTAANTRPASTERLDRLIAQVAPADRKR